MKKEEILIEKKEKKISREEIKKMTIEVYQRIKEFISEIEEKDLSDDKIINEINKIIDDVLKIYNITPKEKEKIINEVVQKVKKNIFTPKELFSFLNKNIIKKVSKPIIMLIVFLKFFEISVFVKTKIDEKKGVLLKEKPIKEFQKEIVKEKEEKSTYKLKTEEIIPKKTLEEESIIAEKIKLNLFNKFEINKAELQNPDLVKKNIKDFLSKTELKDIQKLNEGKGINLIIASGASPERAPKWNLEAVRNFLKENKIQANEEEIKLLLKSVEEYKENGYDEGQLGNIFLSWSRAKILEKNFLEALKEEATTGNEVAKYLLDNIKIKIENYVTDEKDFDNNGIYVGPIDKFKGLTKEEVRNAMFELTAIKEIQKMPSLKPSLKSESISHPSSKFVFKEKNIITNVDIPKITEDLLKYDIIHVDISSSMGETFKSFLKNELTSPSNEETKKYLEEIKKRSQFKKEQSKLSPIQIYAGVEKVNKTSAINNPEDLLRKLEGFSYTGGNERQIRMINQSLDDLIIKIKNKETIDKEIKIVFLTDEAIKFTSSQLKDAENKLKEIEEAGHKVDIDFLFVKEIGKKYPNNRIIKVSFEEIKPYLEKLVPTQKRKKISEKHERTYVFNIVYGEKLQNVGE